MPDNFAAYDFVRYLPELVVATNALEIRLRRARHTAAADRLVKAYADFIKDLDTLAVRVSVRATEMLRASERRTRIRPDTQGGGGPRLEDSLVVEPVAVGVLPGSIGIANESLLDKNVPWWVTNEEGSSGNLGRRLFGTFTGGPGDAPPDETMYPEHPLFASGPGPDAGGGVITRPIPARRFVLKALPEITAYWGREFDLLKARFDHEVEVVKAMAQVPVP